MESVLICVFGLDIEELGMLDYVDDGKIVQLRAG